MSKRRLQLFSSLTVAGLIVALGFLAAVVASRDLRATMQRQMAADNGVISENLRILIAQVTRELPDRDARIERVQRLLQDMQVRGWRGFACVLDDQGRVVAHPNPEMRGHQARLDAYQATDLGYPVQDPPQHLSRLGEVRPAAVYRTEADIIAIQWIPDLMTYLCVHQPRDEIGRRTRALMGQVAGIAALFVLLAAWGAWFFVGRFVDRYAGELTRSEARSRTLVDNSDPILVTDLDGTIVEVNPAAADILAAVEGDGVGKPVSAFWPSDRREELDRILEAPDSVRTIEHLDMKPADGSTVPVTLRACRIAYDTREAVYLLMRDISESRRAREEILEANRKLRELDRLKSDFLNTVSHELRTPLTSIKWSAESLASLNENWDEETFTKLLGIIRDDNRRLSHLIEQLLEFSRIDAGQLVPRFEQVALAPLVAETLSDLEHIAERRGVRLLDPPSSDESIQADPEQLRHALANVIDNAIKYSPAGGSVGIAVQPEGTHVVIAVTDDGIGIHEDQIPRIFDRFYRADSKQVREESGTGLGLAIVKGIVDAHGGTVQVESDPGRGTTFRLRLPRARPSSDGISSSSDA